MKIRAVGEQVIIRVDPLEDVMRQRSGVRDPSAMQRCASPQYTGIVESLGEGFDMDWGELSPEERYRTMFRFPKIKPGDHVVFSRYLHGQYVELVDEGIDYIVLPGIAVIGVIED